MRQLVLGFVFGFGIGTVVCLVTEAVLGYPALAWAPFIVLIVLSVAAGVLLRRR